MKSVGCGIIRISIHALREEGDPPLTGVSENTKISIHALREEGDSHAAVRIDRLLRFLSTPSARRATSSQRDGARRRDISIHALREEGDKS